MKEFKDCTDMHNQGFAINLGCVAGWVVAHGKSYWDVPFVPSEQAKVRNIPCEVARVADVMASVK